MSHLRPQAQQMAPVQDAVSPRWLPLLWLPPIMAKVLVDWLGPSIMLILTPLGLDWADLSGFVVILGLLLVIYVLARLSPGRFRQQVGLVGTPPWTAYAVTFGGLVLVFLIYPVIEYGLARAGVPMYWWTGASLLRASTAAGLAARIILSAIVVPVCEEILFRGYCLGALKRHGTTPSVAIVVSAALFASAHIFVGPGLMVYVLFWGVVPGYLYHRYGHLGPPVALHIGNNLLAYVIIPQLM